MKKKTARSENGKHKKDLSDGNDFMKQSRVVHTVPYDVVVRSLGFANVALTFLF